MSGLNPRGYVKNAHGFLAPHTAAPFAYSDGHVAESKLAAALETCSDRSTYSIEMLGLCKGWVPYYHFTPQRANLLHPVRPLLQGAQVLELGAGCGALTRFLAEQARRVVALEGSPVRSRINAMRMQGLSSAVVVNDTIQDFQWAHKFDVVTLIGVLEYARQFDSQSPCPELRILEIARSWLKPGGHLLLAIENKLGIKYFAGAREDHFLEPYHGINNLYTPTSTATWGRRELEGLLHKAGFANLTQMIPLPDYKIPRTVLHQNCFDGSQPGIDPIPLISDAFHYDMQYFQPTFSLESVTRSLVDNGLMQDLCSSFFYIASPDAQTPPLNPDILAYHYGGKRLPQYLQETLFIRDGEEVRVEKKPLVPEAAKEAAARNDALRQTTGSEVYNNNPVYMERLLPIVNTPGWTVEDVCQWVRPFITLLESVSEKAPGGTRMVPGNYFDCTPFNCFWQEGTLVPFDLEWEMNNRLPLDLVAFRGLYMGLRAFGSMAQPHPDVPQGVVALAVTVLDQCKISLKTTDVEDYLGMNRDFLGATCMVNFSMEGQLGAQLPVRG